jgi:elongation factor P--(R)-beta-lysine ligase
MNGYRQTKLKKNLQLRADVIHCIRQFFRNQGYLAVETPVRIPAPAPEIHIDAEPSGDRFLITSPELCMKRLLAAGYPKIFQICKCFRKGERGDRHLPEMTLLEWYCAGITYADLMDQCENLVRYVAEKVNAGDVLTYQGKTIDLAAPWPRISVTEAFDRYASISMADALAKDRFDEVMALEIEPELGRSKPVFLYDYPAEKGALARLKPEDSSLAERFELYIAGIELCNGFSELTDPAEQRMRFEIEMNARKELGKQFYPAPEHFLSSLKDMPEAAGNAFGIDRLTMLFADTTTIDDVVAFTPEEL